jgi:DNA-binding PadR family transcriptional regulator
MIKLPLTLEHALLGFLREQPMHAYEMYQRLEQAQALGRVWHLKQSQLYALLARLEEAGYIEATTEPQGNRPPRRVLHLTPSGRSTFACWLREPVAHGRDFRQEFMAKLFFAQQEGPASVAELIAGQRAACERWLADIRAHADAIGDDQRFDWLVLQFRIGNLEMILRWLDTCTATFAVPSPS